jgi:hypothetical protein
MRVSDSVLQMKMDIPPKRGISWRKFVFSGVNAKNDSELLFFVEFIALNTLLSPQEVIRNEPVSAETKAGHFVRKQLPGYILLRAGYFGTDGIIFEDFLPAEAMSFGREENSLVFGQSVLGPAVTTGCIEQSSVVYSLFSDSRRKDTFSWNLAMRYESVFSAQGREPAEWFCAGAKALLSGSFRFNNDAVNIAASAIPVYMESFYARDTPAYWFHVSAVQMLSKINNTAIEVACVNVQSFQANSAAVCLALGGIRLTFKPANPRKQRQTAACTRSEDSLHWSVSVDNPLYLLDLDIFCPTDEMKLLNYDSPQGEGKVLSLFCGATGKGELRLYKRLKKGLELIEHADISNARCEFGAQDTLEAE